MFLDDLDDKSRGTFDAEQGTIGWIGQNGGAEYGG
jgi:hypothetical protein